MEHGTEAVRSGPLVFFISVPGTLLRGKNTWEEWEAAHGTLMKFISVPGTLFKRLR